MGGRRATGCDYLSLPPQLITRIRVCRDTGCWVWEAGVSAGRGSDYGRAWYQGMHWSAHILVHYLVRGRRVAKRFVHDHECCRRRCCRPGPGHVVPRSHSNNMKLIHVRAKRSIRCAEIHMEETGGQAGVSAGSG